MLMFIQDYLRSEAFMKSLIERQIRDSIAVKQAVLRNPRLMAQLAAVAARAVAVYRQGGQILLAGNGGSAADAQHIAGELVCRFNFDRPGLPAIALSTDPSVVTSISNDYGYAQIFARQVQALGRKGDMFIGISTSGASPNVLQALRAARKRGLICVGLTGQSGGRMAALCDYCLRAPSRETPRIQEVHGLLAHILCGLIEDALFG